MLSCVSAEAQCQISNDRLEALAKLNRISPKTELRAIVEELDRQNLISKGESGIEVLGLTSSSILSHTSTIFEETSNTETEEAVLSLSETLSDKPATRSDVSEFIEDTYKIDSEAAGDLLTLGSSVGFFDTEKQKTEQEILFNGNLFKRGEVNKTHAVLSSLSEQESAKIREFNDLLKKRGCVALNATTRFLGEALFKKLNSIGMIEVNVVGNEKGKAHFVTHPASFSKFSNSIVDDALDLAKAFVVSLTYGMTTSAYSRGRIQEISVLMGKLISGFRVGPATAIGRDYKVLEQKGVIQLSPAKNNMFYMKLLKPEVGRLALAVINEGSVVSEALQAIPGASVTTYTGPEVNREIIRKSSSPEIRTSTRNLLNEIRTGII